MTLTQEMEIAKTTKVTSKEFALHDGPFVKGLDEALQSFKVQRQQYFGGVFVGITTSTRHYRLESSKFSSVVITHTLFSQQTSSVCAPLWYRGCKN